MPDADCAERLLDRIMDGVFGLDTSWEFTYLNDRSRSTVHDAVSEEFTADELVGRNIWDLLPQARDSVFETKYREAVRTQESVSFDARYGPLDAWIEVTPTPPRPD
ncbi:PAS domain-containing protein [Haloplanus salilacus]|uniref:PAS domain-containing protein n=1 Tax=Haloplanus salilacus TaxID=2949994 RepID=UPI0030D32EE5